MKAIYPTNHRSLYLVALITFFLFLPTNMFLTAKNRHIKSVEPIIVETPSGTVPRLPWQVWVTYSDGHNEWRQVKWNNATRDAEEEEANVTLHPAGSEYRLQGFILGDNSTSDGYPIEAIIRVAGTSLETPEAAPKAHAIPLKQVMLMGDNRLTSNRNHDIDALLQLDVAQQLYNYYDTYGLPTDGMPESDGWDSPTTKLKGHGSGHYMSAMAFAFAGCDDPVRKDQLRSNIRRMVDELRMCQERTFVWSDSLGRWFEARDLAPEEELRTLRGTWDAFDEYKKDWKHYGYGYLNAIPAQHPALIEMYRAYNNEEWVWAPYYSIHKQLAGLIDIADNIDDPVIAAKAKLIAKDMGLWVWNRLHYRTYVKADGTREERQERPGNRYEMWNMYIAGEVGGMAESLSRLSWMADDPTEKAHLLEAANCFDAPVFYEPLSKGIDDIRTRHANQHIPMITGALWSFRCNANPYYYNVARNFWEMIQARYVYAMGGVGNGEMFRQPYTQILSMNTNTAGWGGIIEPNPDLNETCCAYNLAKLTKDLNGYDPDDARYMDYYERVLYNQLVGSVHPDKHSTTYQYAVGLDAIKPFGNETPQSSCCGGTGAENHVKYQEAAWFVNEQTVWVALYLPTTAQWEEKGITLVQDCHWPAEHSTITVKGDATFSMKLRVPYWATEGFDVKLNGTSIAKEYRPCSYIEIPQRVWRNGDKVEIDMPFTVHINWGPDKMEVAAAHPAKTKNDQPSTPARRTQALSDHFAPQWVGTLMYGPLVMASDEIHEWKDAEFELRPDLSDIIPQGTTADKGTMGNVYSLTLEGRTFRPDYWQTDHSTHYLRLNVLTKRNASSHRRKVNFDALDAALSLAETRCREQQEWEALTVKTPSHAPWAPYGFARMDEERHAALSLRHQPRKQLKQSLIDTATANLNAAINTLRPGNLAEPEDLDELLTLLFQARYHPGKTTELREAIDYGDMVSGYVNDGSGTHDLIAKAVDKLRIALSHIESTQSDK